MKTVSNLLDLTLDGLKKRLRKSSLNVIQRTQGYTLNTSCSFSKPASKREIDEFQKETGLILPNSLKLFLSIHNGAELFKDEEEKVEPSWYVLGLDEIEDYLERYPAPSHIYVIAKYDQTLICVNAKRVKEGREDYLLDRSVYDSAEYEGEPINLNFEIWFDRLITAQGAFFWSWNHNSQG